MHQAPDAPQPIGGVLDEGFRLYRAGLKASFLLAAAVALFWSLFSWWAQRKLTLDLSLGKVLPLLVELVVVAIPIVVLSGAIIAMIDSCRGDRGLPLGDALAIGRRRAPALLGAIVCFFALVAFIFLMTGAALLAFALFSTGYLIYALCGLIGLTAETIVMVALLFGNYAVVIDGKGPVEALGYSWRLVRGYWWHTAAVVTVIGIILAVFYVVVLLIDFATAVNPADLTALAVTPWYVQFLLLPAVSALLIPLGHALLIATYHDLKLRHSGDLSPA